MQVKKIETFKEWLLLKNLKLCNRKPKTETEFDIKLLLDKTPTTQNEKRKKRFQTANYHF
jgi:hypothetical protein